METKPPKPSISSKSSICIDEIEIKALLKAYELADITEEQCALGDLMLVLSQWYAKYGHLVKDR